MPNGRPNPLKMFISLNVSETSEWWKMCSHLSVAVRTHNAEQACSE